MREITVRLHEDTIENIEAAAKQACLTRAAYVRNFLEESFDGTPRNPLGLIASPLFFDQLSDAIGVLIASKGTMTKAELALAEKRAREVRDQLETSHEH